MPRKEDAADVNQLRQEVSLLRKDVEDVRSSMQQIHREVGSAILLLSRSIGLQWDTDEAVRLMEEQTVASDKLKQVSETVDVLEQRLAASEESKTGGDDPVGAEGILDGEGRDQISSVISGSRGSEAVATLTEGGGKPVGSNKLRVSRHQSNADLSLNAGVEHEDRSRQPRYESEALDCQLSPSPTPPLRGIPQGSGVDGADTVTTCVSLSQGSVSDRLLRPEATLYGDGEDAEAASRVLVGADAVSARQLTTTPQDTVDAVTGKGNLRAPEDAGSVGQDIKAGETMSVEGRPTGAILSTRRASSIFKSFVASPGISVEHAIQSPPPSKEVADPLEARRAFGHSSGVNPHIDIDDNGVDRNGNPEEPEKTDASDIERCPSCNDVSVGEIASATLVSSPRIEGSARSNTSSRRSGSWTSRSTDSQSSKQTAVALSSGSGEKAGRAGPSRQSSGTADYSPPSTAKTTLDKRPGVNDEQPPSVGGSRLDTSLPSTETLASQAVEAASSDVSADRQIVEVEGGPGDDVGYVGASAQPTRTSASLHLPAPTARGTRSPSSEGKDEGSGSSGSLVRGSEDGPGVNRAPDSSARVREASSPSAAPVPLLVRTTSKGGLVTGNDPAIEDY